VLIDIAPLVDVVFLLVIFFAVSTTFLDTAGLQLELPTSTSTAPREQKDVIVMMSADGTLKLGNETLDLATLRDRLRSELADRERKIVILRADAATTHGQVVGVMDAIREAGAESLTVAAKAPPEPAAGR